MAKKTSLNSIREMLTIFMIVIHVLTISTTAHYYHYYKHYHKTTTVTTTIHVFHKCSATGPSSTTFPVPSDTSLTTISSPNTYQVTPSITITSSSTTSSTSPRNTLLTISPTSPERASSTSSSTALSTISTPTNTPSTFLAFTLFSSFKVNYPGFNQSILGLVTYFQTPDGKVIISGQLSQPLNRFDGTYTFVIRDENGAILFDLTKSIIPIQVGSASTFSTTQNLVLLSGDKNIIGKYFEIRFQNTVVASGQVTEGFGV